MSASSWIKQGTVAVLAVLLAATICTSACAKSDNVTIETGTVALDRNADVVVVLDDQRWVYPSNGHGLFRSGQINVGDVVEVKIVYDNGDKRHKHRGHVTILK